ncbi:MAG: aspartate ammonia-lyase [Bacteroidota bacterium]
MERFIDRIELFKGLSKEEKLEVIDNLEELNVKKGDTLFERNTKREYIYLIYDGEVELVQISSLGKENRLTVFGRLDFLGEGSLNDDAPHSTTARALKDSRIFTIHRDFFKSHGAISLKIFSNVTRVISRRMRHSNERAMHVVAQYESGRTRREHDLLGYRDVPDEYYYGIQTLRAMENFEISGVTLNFFPDLIEGLAVVKMAAAITNYELGLLTPSLRDAIVRACNELRHGKYHNHFTVDMIQGGAGTSTNMNANEVIANRALQILGYEKGQYEHCHPNNHINLSQSTNDAYPTAVKLALYKSNKKLVQVLEKLIEELHIKGRAFNHIIKMGRTQLQDAVPMTLGQTFEAFADTLQEEIDRLKQNAELFLEVNMGATAIGTGINADPEYAEKVIRHLRDITGYNVNNALNLVEATSDTGDFVMYSSALKRLAVKLSKVSNDLRLLSSGPRTGINEINLPPMQPGSSIMPGKVNPVIPEVVNQIAFKVIGNDLTVTMAAEAGQLELNVMEPVIMQSLFESIEMLKNGMNTLNHRCIKDITANEEHCRHQVYNSIGLVTALNPLLGYEASSKLAQQALKENRSVYDLVLEQKLLSKKDLEEVLKPENMIRPRKMN